MTDWEQKIIDAFMSHYYASAPETGEDRSTLRLRSSVFFPNFNTASPDEKVSYLEAAESLERKGIVALKWEKRSKGERLRTISCENFAAIFEAAQIPFSKSEAEEIRAMLAAKAAALKQSLATWESKIAQQKFVQEKDSLIQQHIALLEFLSLHFGPRDIGQGINKQIMENYARLLEFISDPAQLENITNRALSTLLYRDSKQLEHILAVCKPLVSRAKKAIPIPDLSFLERSYPETMISGRISIEYQGEKMPLANAGGHIIGIPLENAEQIERITLLPAQSSALMPATEEKTVLTIENKETFYALGSPKKLFQSKGLSRFSCFLYIGGYSNRAAAALVKALADSGFSFCHAGDLDPDGILILQQIQETAERPVTPLRMDAATFDCYLPWARTLTKPMLGQIKKIKDETRAIPGIASLLRRIEETSLGVEQEIVNYREIAFN